LGLNKHLPKAHQRYAEEDQPESRYRSAVHPDRIETGRSKEHRLREADKVSGG
jgi:hypothetical protein